jgi:hypothetical protein
LERIDWGVVMISKSFAVIGVLMLLSLAAYAGSAPKELYGKSIIVTWGEHRSQREFGAANFREVNFGLSRTIYVSTKGQWFSRFAAGSQSHESIGTSGTPLGGGLRGVQFSGQSITVTSASNGGIGRRITINFNESFSTCEANVIFAKQTGSDVVITHNLTTGVAAGEIRSATVTSTSCSVRDGNVFAQ